MGNFSPGNRGFTLLEVMIVLALFAIAIIPVLGFFSDSVLLLHHSEKRSQGLKLARSTMEVFKKKAVTDYLNLSTEADSFSLTDVASGNDLFTDDYNLSVTITGFDFDGDGDIDSEDSELGKKIEITVDWENGNKKVELQSLLRKR